MKVWTRKKQRILSLVKNIEESLYNAGKLSQNETIHHNFIDDGFLITHSPTMKNLNQHHGVTSCK